MYMLGTEAKPTSWEPHGPFGGEKSNPDPFGVRYFVVPNCETHRWEVYLGGARIEKAVRIDPSIDYKTAEAAKASI